MIAVNSHIALTIAGFDPCGGAGLQADLKTFQSHGVYGLSAAAALTVQNTRGVKSVYPLPDNQLKEQLENLIEDFNVQSVKIGMLGSDENALAVARFLQERRFDYVVLDPIINSQSGLELNNASCLRVMSEELIPQSALLTPNTEEAARLCRFPVNNKAGMRRAAEYLCGLGCRYVLIKGGHLQGNVCIDLFSDGENHFFRQWPRMDGDSPHGTGCVLSAAVAANLALGQSMAQAVTEAQDYLAKIRRHPLILGSGYPLLPHPYKKE